MKDCARDKFNSWDILSSYRFMFPRRTAEEIEEEAKSFPTGNGTIVKMLVFDVF